MGKKRQIVADAAVIIIILVCAVWVISGFVHIGNSEYTDNAQVRQHITPVNTRVQGFIRHIYFDEYQPVCEGDTLVIIEDSEYRLRVAQAEADLQKALVEKEAMITSISTTGQNISVTDAAIKEAQVRYDNSCKEYARYSALLEQEAVTQQQFDAVKTEYDATGARLDQLRRQRQSIELGQHEQVQRLEQCEASIRLAEAALDLARLNLSYTVVIATADGLTGRKNIHEGELVQPGQTLLSIVDSSDKWVIANYKETQTSGMETGQAVDITVDAVPGVIFKGVVESISDATGASYSLIPQDNSAGNFVKVEQRIPVRVSFTSENKASDMSRLRAGMNAECKGYTCRRSQRWPVTWP